MKPDLVWAIYHAPTGSPAPFLVMTWEPGRPPQELQSIFAATLKDARITIPSGLQRRDPVKRKGARAKSDPANLIEVWRHEPDSPTRSRRRRAAAT